MERFNKVGRFKYLYEFQSSDSASETKNLARDPPAQIKEFQKKEACDEYDKSSIELCCEQFLKAQKRRMIDDIAKLEEMEAKLEAEKRRIRREYPKMIEIRLNNDAANIRITKEKKAKLEAACGRKTEENVQDLLGGEGISASELEKFVKQLDANVKSQVDYSDFKILEKDLGKDLKMVGRFSVPLCLAPISERINDTFGDITSDSSQSDCAAMPSYVLFCAAIKEMDDLKLDQVDETKILLWRDAINCARNVQFKVDFAIKHLKKIARAYFGLKAMEGKSSEQLKNIDGTVRKIEVPQDYLREAKYFWGKPLSTGLFH